MRYYKRFSVVRVVDIDNVSVDQKIYRYFRGDTRLETLYRKGDFNDMRKLEGGAAYILAQSKEFITPVKQIDDYIKSIDYSARFVDLQNYQACSFSGHTEPFNRIQLMLTDNTCRTFNYHGKGADLNAIIDKSGYLVGIKRDNLQRRAAALRAERDQAAFSATDNASILKGLRERLTALKQELAAQLVQAETSDQICKVAKSIRYFDGLEGAFSDFERIAEKDAAKSYASIGAFNNAVAALNAKISGLAG